MSFSRWLLAATALVASVSSANAATILYTLTTTSTGRLNGVDYGPTTLTITAKADTDAGYQYGNRYGRPITDANYVLDGVSSGKVNGQLAFNFETTNAWLGYAGASDIIKFSSYSLSGYNGSTEIDIISAPVLFNLDFFTDAGVLRPGRLRSISFNAKIIPDSVAGVPEPATWLTMIAGFGLVGAALRRSNKAIKASAA